MDLMILEDSPRDINKNKDRGSHSAVVSYCCERIIKESSPKSTASSRSPSLPLHPSRSRLTGHWAQPFFLHGRRRRGRRLHVSKVQTVHLCKLSPRISRAVISLLRSRCVRAVQFIFLGRIMVG